MHQRTVRSILIIDDDQEDYEFLQEALQEIDPEISVSHISKCEEGVQHKFPQFDLVLLDINMPLHDGFYWLRSIRSLGYNNLPVIMYTNSLSPAHIAKAYDEGANLYFSKPERFPQLKQGLKDLIRMDWSDPFSITEEYCAEGRYKTFPMGSK